MKINKKPLLILLCILVVGFSVFLYSKFNNKTSEVSLVKSYHGLNLVGDDIIGETKIDINGIIDPNYKYVDFENVEKLTGTITINNEEYPLEGVSVFKDGDKDKKYVGATAYTNSKKDKTKYYVYFLEDYEYIRIFNFNEEEEDVSHSEKIFAPAKTKEDIEKINSMMP